MSQPYNILPTKTSDRIAKTFYYNKKGELRWWNGKRLKNKEADKRYRADNREKIKKYRADNREKSKKYSKKYRSGLKWLLRRRERYKNDQNFRLKSLLRSRFRDALISKNIKKKSHVLELTSCSMDFLKKYLSKQFENGMTWENHGEWHIDHRKPCASFDLRNEEEQRKCFHYTNLQPLWGKENKEKGSTFNEATFEYTWIKHKGWVKN